MASFLDEVWQDAVGGLDWLKQVVLGEFDDHRSTSAVIADMLLSFVPGVIIVTSARDLTAVIIRLAKHPDRREKLEEWMILIACVIPLIIPILAAAAGAVVAGVGSVIGGIGGSEAGAALRATCLLLIEESGKMLEPLVKFLRRFIKGDILAVLRDIKFAKYGKDLAHYTFEFIGKLRVVVQKVAAKLIPLRGYFSSVETLLTKLNELERGFYAVQTAALQKIPLALAELDARLAKALAEEMKPLEHPAHPKFPAPKPKPVPPTPAKVPTMAGNPLGVPEGTRPEGLPPAAGEKTNLHPQTTAAPPIEMAAADADVTKAAAARARQQKMLNDNVGYNISPTSWDSYETIGRNGTFVTDQQGVADVLGDTSGQTEMTISSDQAAQIEKNMGLSPGSLQDGFKVRQVTGLQDMSPRSPLEGNDYFLGPGQGLPNGAPEMVVNSIPTADYSTPTSSVTTILNVGVSH